MSKRKNREKSVFLRHIPCTNPECLSSDANSLYADGSTYCFSCEAVGKATDEEAENPQPTFGSHTAKGRMDGEEKARLLQGKLEAIPNRGLSADTCKLYGYEIGTDEGGKPCHIANYRDFTGRRVAQKIRYAGKDFHVRGDLKKAGLFGAHLWKATEKNRLAITEGELDAMSLSQALGNKWPVVSVPNGAQGALKAIMDNLDYVRSFQEVVLFFDMDEPGRAAAEAVARKLPPGKVRIAFLSVKDANEALVKGKVQELIHAYWNAPPWRPEGIVEGKVFTRESLKTTTALGYPIRIPILQDMLQGIRKREITLLTAGTGIGKSTLARELAYELHQRHGLKVANIYLEESKEKTAQGYIAIHNNVPLGRLRADPTILSDEQWDKTLADVIHERMWFYDHFGSLDSDHLLSKLEYLAVGCEVDFIILDHISIVISGNESSSEGERKDIDRFMTNLRSIVERTGVGVIAICHLKQPEGKPHEEGGRVTLSQLRGSGSLKQIPDTIIALERDQQDRHNKNLCLVRLLKNREHGELGEADTLEYATETGRLDVSDRPISGQAHNGFSAAEGLNI